MPNWKPSSASAGDNVVMLRTVDEFVDEVLYGRAYDLRASIVGFNLPFDISRLAIGHGSARGKAMRGGFTFKLSRDDGGRQYKFATSMRGPR